jgi:hypothetical protein
MNHSAAHFAERGLSHLLSVEPAQRDKTEQALGRLYQLAGKPTPTLFLWHASPLEALWSFAALSEKHDALTKLSLESVRQNATTLAKLKQVQSNIQTRTDAATWADALAAVGTWQSANTGMPAGALANSYRSNLSPRKFPF